MFNKINVRKILVCIDKLLRRNMDESCDKQVDVSTNFVKENKLMQIFYNK